MTYCNLFYDYDIIIYITIIYNNNRQYKYNIPIFYYFSNQRMGSYSTATKCNRWPVKMFSFVLDVTRVNAQSVFCLNNSLDGRKGIESFDFGWQLGMALVKPHMVARRPTMTRRGVLAKIDLFVRKEMLVAAGGDGDNGGGGGGGGGGDNGGDGGDDGGDADGRGENNNSGGGIGEAGGEEARRGEPNNNEPGEEVRDRLFPHRSEGDLRRRCQTCAKNLPRENYKKAYSQLSKRKSQCAR